MKKTKFKSGYHAGRLILAAALVIQCLVALPSKAVTSASSDSPLITSTQQSAVVKGTVKDDSGEPIIGASIVVKGTREGTITDVDGNFSISAASGTTLTISYIGFKSQTVKVTGAMLYITLHEDNANLDELVVVGYGTQKKANLTGAVASVSVEDMGSRPITNSSNMLQGTASGVYSLQSSGQPGADEAVLNIRGVGTLNNSDPLVLIDGFPGSMTDVDASEIESISVLKDAASAAIYGNRAANGVVLVTTKKGRVGKVKVSYSGYLGLQEATALPSTLNSYQYALLYNEANRNDGSAVTYTDEDLQKFRDGSSPYTHPNIDYFDVYYDTATMQNHRINVSGGSDNLQYAFMMGYLDQEGILIGTDYHKADFRSNVDAYLFNKKLRFTTRLAGNYGNKKEPTELWNTKWYATVAPIYPLTNEDGVYVAVNGEDNYYGRAKAGSLSTDKRYVFNGQVEAEYKIWDGLSAQLTYGYNFEQANVSAFNANITMANGSSLVTKTSSLTEDRQTNIQTLLTALVKYDKTFGLHTVGAMVGYSEESFDYKLVSAYRQNFVNNTQIEMNLGDSSTMTNDGDHYDLGLRSWFGRVNYSFDNKYLFEANVRRDGSSRFADGKKWGTFPSFSGGWVVSEEKFMRSTRSWLDMLKVRVSWGKLGNQNINSYYVGSDVLNSGNNYSLGGSLQSGVAVTSLNNKETTWETTTQTDIGIDMAFLNGFNLTLDYFIKNTKDILMQKPIPVSMGNLDAPYVNAGSVRNKGIEATLSYRKKFRNGIKLSTSLNLSHIVNKITSLNGSSPIIDGCTAQVEGYAINSYYGYIQDGIYQIDDFTWQNDSDPTIDHYDREYKLKDGVVSVANYTAQPGDWKFKDLDGDGVVTMDGDRTVIGKMFPDLTYGWSCSLEWKNIDFNMFWQGVAGIDGYTYYEIASCFSGVANMGDWWMDRWTPENPSNSIPRVTHNTNITGIHSTYYMEDASYLRLKNIELGYTFDHKLLSFLGDTKVRVYGNIQNAFTITNYKGFDPEQTISENRAESFPQVRIYTIGININF